jgi:hypothetical protein
MNQTLTTVLGGDRIQSTAAVFLVDYLKAVRMWPESGGSISRAEFRKWLLRATYAQGTYGLEYVLGGFDGLASAGYLKESAEPNKREVTKKFVDAILLFQSSNLS